MVTKNKNQKYHEDKKANGLYGWKPPLAIHPGNFLRNALEERGMKQADLAERIDLSKKSINDIIQGRSHISLSTAFKLSKVFHFSVDYWMRLQQSYDNTKARSEENKRVAQDIKKNLQNFKEAFQELKTIGFTSKLNWVEKNFEKITEELQKFYGVGSLGLVDNTMNYAFLRKYKRDNVNPYTLSAWLRVGEIKAQEVQVKDFDEKKLKEKLPELKKLSTKFPESYLSKVREILADCGVVVVYMPKMKNTFAQGASMWITNNKVLLMLNTHKRNEGQFWFNLFHEIGHIVLHKKSEPFVDYYDENDYKSEEEKQADNFAQKHLISDFKKTEQRFKDISPKIGWEQAIKKVAKEEGVSPAIFAGRLTYEYGKDEEIYKILSVFLHPKINYNDFGVVAN